MTISQIRRHKAHSHIVLTVIFAILVFFILAITMLLVAAALVTMVHMGILDTSSTPNALLPIITIAITSILVGTIVAAAVSHIPLKPLKMLIDGMKRLASGDYSARIELNGIATAREIADSFNTLASELQNTEMLRSDFVNNFSHEFKTPIVSIRGFAKLMQKKKLSEGQQSEYLAIIVDETTRLTDMATNVLNLTKIENQSILTEVTCYNLSEQIRKCILLLEKKWLQKRIQVVADFGEHDINANEELLKQVWINLLDNAIKFSPEDGEVAIAIKEMDNNIAVLIKNNGTAISEQESKHIFDKFYQGDTSHAVQGTGIGLSVAKRIVELHKGDISAHSIHDPDETTFMVDLPKEQLHIPTF